MFITFEGIDGSGKTTQINKLAEFIKNFFDKEVVITKEPGGTSIGARLRQEILHGENITDKTELLLYMADRNEHVERVIKPAIARGAVVISDRFADSTLAYQGAGRKIDSEIVERLNNFVTSGLKPDLTILLDIEAHISKQRVEGTGEKKDRLESSKIDFFERTREEFLALASGEEVKDGGRWLVLDGNGDIDEISNQVETAVNNIFSKTEGE
jgi:dTMP kinase